MRKLLLNILVLCLSTLEIYSQSQSDSSFYRNEHSVWLTRKTGAWDVIMTLQLSVTERPIRIEGLEAQRSMVGAFCLHEIMEPVKGSSMPLFKRMSDLDYNLNASKWDYISIDTRITGGIMFFTNYGMAGDSIVSYIQDFPHPGFGPKQTDRGKTVRLKNVIVHVDANHDIVKQYWKLTDGVEWLAVIYEYSRRK